MNLGYLMGLVCIIEHSNHHCSGKMHGMGHAGPHVLLYELTRIVEEVALHSCIVINNYLIIDDVMALNLYRQFTMVRLYSY